MGLKKYSPIYYGLLVISSIAFSLALTSCTIEEYNGSKQLVYSQLVRGRWEITFNNIREGKDIGYSLLKPTYVLEFFEDGSLSIGPDSFAAHYSWPDETHLRIDTPDENDFGSGIILKASISVLNVNKQSDTQDLILKNNNEEAIMLHRLTNDSLKLPSS